jgi:phosphatidylglycerophosphate synthase
MKPGSKVRARIADGITVSRVAIAPLLILAAARGATDLYTGLIALGLVSDALDGPWRAPGNSTCSTAPGWIRAPM